MTKLCLDLEMLTDDFFEDTRLLALLQLQKIISFAGISTIPLIFVSGSTRKLKCTFAAKTGAIISECMSTMCETALCRITFIKTVMMANFCCPNSGIWIFCGLSKTSRQTSNQCNQLVTSIKEMQGVIMVAELTNEKIKNKKHLIF